MEFPSPRCVAHHRGIDRKITTTLHTSEHKRRISVQTASLNYAENLKNGVLTGFFFFDLEVTLFFITIWGRRRRTKIAFPQRCPIS